MAFTGFTTEALEALDVAGVSERWAAVQEHLHPLLEALASHIAETAAQQLPAVWPLYEVTFKVVRSRGGGTRRAPIDEYHFVLDRPPRGASIYVGVSGTEQRVLVGIQLWKHRKHELNQLWEQSRAIWEPLVDSIDDVRFAHSDSPTSRWLDDYLASKTGYLWAGWSYPWSEAIAQGAEFAATLTARVLELLPLNEALMEAAEEHVGQTPLRLREERPPYQPAFSHPPIETISAAIAQRGFVFPDSLLRSYHVALQSKPLVILSGISGTGKTRLSRLYADAIHHIQPGADNPFYLAVAVQPDWHNARDLLGYYNALTDRFQPTPTLRLLLRAAADPAHPYYLCLDEMNLARPEYYLAPFLSALETAEHLIDLGVPAETVRTTSDETLRNPLRLPLNLHLIGTVNVDESTFGLSDKLLDRANVIELTTVDLAAFRASAGMPFDDSAWEMLLRLQPILAQTGQPFGYRAVAEIGRYLQEARGILDPTTALDAQIKQKLLPKVRGDDTPRFRKALRELLAAVEGYPQTAAKVAAMIERLEREGYTDFH